MQKIALVTDSCADTPSEAIDTYGIHVIPVRINYENESFLDRIEITPQEIYARFNEEIPKTSLPSPGEVDLLFQQLEKEGYTHVLAITIASGLSGTHDLIHSVAIGHSSLVCEVIDSKLIGLGVGMVVDATAEKLSEGASFEEAVEYTHHVIGHTHLYFCVNTLDYLYKGGRIGSVTYQVGTKFDIRPVITCDTATGSYITASKAHGRKASLKRAMKLVLKDIEGAQRLRFAVAHGDAESEAQELLENLKEAIPHAEKIYFDQITPALVVHTGPGLIGIGVQIMDD